MENRLHQLSPYVGKLKSEIANQLIQEFSKPGELIVDPFVGSGTVALEAILLGRRSFSADISPYARLLTLAKTTHQTDLDSALMRHKTLVRLAENLNPPDLRLVPKWVRAFFHPRTLKEVIAYCEVCRKGGDYFHLACILGILHHERPGFLSYPSSHLVPYLRNKKYPRDVFPQMYTYRNYRERIEAKIKRVLKDFKPLPANLARHPQSHFRMSSVFGLTLPRDTALVLTSPPYMNALDYGRDNRLRLWFLGHENSSILDSKNIKTKATFSLGLKSLRDKSAATVPQGKFVVLVIGEKVNSARQHLTSEIAENIFKDKNDFKLIETRDNLIPSTRRSRRNCKAVENEQILIFQRR